jgi:hypothetical protein
MVTRHRNRQICQSSFVDVLAYGVTQLRMEGIKLERATSVMTIPDESEGFAAIEVQRGHGHLANGTIWYPGGLMKVTMTSSSITRTPTTT